MTWQLMRGHVTDDVAADEGPRDRWRDEEIATTGGFETDLVTGGSRGTCDRYSGSFSAPSRRSTDDYD